jgi:hypothetical protein
VIFDRSGRVAGWRAAPVEEAHHDEGGRDAIGPWRLGSHRADGPPVSGSRGTVLTSAYGRIGRRGFG